MGYKIDGSQQHGEVGAKTAQAHMLYGLTKSEAMI
jgi:hypothetical protein